MAGAAGPKAIIIANELQNFLFISLSETGKKSAKKSLNQDLK
jgi:hypothetical protein